MEPDAEGTCAARTFLCALHTQMKGVHITLRMRLECRIVRRGMHASQSHAEVHEVLNEVVVDRGANPYLAKIECWERDTLITKACARQSPPAQTHAGCILAPNMSPGLASAACHAPVFLAVPCACKAPAQL